MKDIICDKDLFDSIPLPMCAVDSNGKIIGFNSHIGEVFLYDDIIGSDFFAITGLKIEDVINAGENKTNLTIERSDKTFRVFTGRNDFARQNKALILDASAEAMDVDNSVSETDERVKADE